MDINDLKKRLNNKSRLMGVDMGSKRVGISISDENRKIATPLKVLNYISMNKLIEDMIGIILEHNVDGIIYGNPLNMDGSLGKSAQSGTDTALLISQNLKIPYGFWDERLSSVAVERYFEKPKKSRKKNMINKKEIDNLAAAFILDGALQYINN